MVRLRNISARVFVDGVGLPEYAPRYDAEKKELSCWIPSEPGKEFKVFLKRNSCDYHGSASFSIDGVVVRRQLSWRGEDSVFACDFMRTRTNSERPLLFSRMQLPDSNAYLNTSSLPPQHGDIRIRHGVIQQAGRMDYPQHNLPASLGMARETQRPVPHFTQLGQERGINNTASGTHSGYYIEHLITVVFRYRPLGTCGANSEVVDVPPNNISLDELQASGIAPRAPSSPRTVFLPLKTINHVPLSRKRKLSSAHLDDESDLEELEMELEVKRLELRVARLQKQKHKRAKSDTITSVHPEPSSRMKGKAERDKRTPITKGKITPTAEVKKERL